MHVTARAVRGLPSFRQQRIASLVLLQMRRLNDARFQIVHFSVQSNHVHLIVEGEDREAVIAKMSGFMISFAKRLNLRLGRKGKVWRERYYRRDITRTREMHNVLAYVFGNAKKHGLIPRDALEIDYLSSAYTFEGFDLPVVKPPEKMRFESPKPKTDLLRVQWRIHGLVRLASAPRARTS